MNDKLTINTTLLRKEPCYEPKPCIVERVVEMSAGVFAKLVSKPLDDHYLIKKNSDLMFSDGDVYHCILAVDKLNGDGLLIEAEGSGYARYSQYIPHAMDIISQHDMTPAQKAFQGAIKEIAHDLLAESGEKTEVNYSLDELLLNAGFGRPLLHTAVYIEMIASSLEALRNMQTEVQTELVRSKLNVDRLMLRQQSGFNSIKPGSWNVFREQFERVLPASSTANLYPFSFSGKTDEHGCYLGRDKFCSNIIVDFDKRSDDKTNANMLILGNSGQGKSYLLKLILTNLRESGKRIICLDPELEYAELTDNLGGCFIDLMSGKYIINVLEPKTWDEGAEVDEAVPQAFRGKTRLSQHISFLRDFFRCYKDFSDREIDIIELMLIKLYDSFGVNIYTAETLQNICLGLHSMCMGAESKFFNGHTNITDGSFDTFGVKGLLQASKNIRSALLFNVLSYMSNELLTTGNTVASVDEFYLFLTNPVAVEYIRNFMKRVRKKNLAVILDSQNLEDFNLEGIRELTKLLFAIPTHQFLFYAGTVDKEFYIDNLQLEPSEYELTRYSQRGVCLYKCGNERYCLCVHAPDYKERLFGSAGGR